MSEENKIGTHTCEGIRKHWKYEKDYGCVPRIEEDGTIRACDAENKTIVQYCPYCGTKIEYPNNTP